MSRLGPVRRRARAVPLALALSLVTACGSTPAPPTTASPFADCAALTTSGPAARPADLPAMRLPCFTGGQQVDLTAIGGPAVINFWASWCGPCRTELPVLQRFADRAQGRVRVLGVDTGDRREAGASFAADHQVTMPTLVDADRRLFAALGGRGLPMTVFIDAAGHRYVHPLPLDERQLAEQVRAHCGVTVAE